MTEYNIPPNPHFSWYEGPYFANPNNPYYWRASRKTYAVAAAPYTPGAASWRLPASFNGGSPNPYSWHRCPWRGGRRFCYRTP